jgi:hypothetical protein
VAAESRGDRGVVRLTVERAARLEHETVVATLDRDVPLVDRAARDVEPEGAGVQLERRAGRSTKRRVGVIATL